MRTFFILLLVLTLTGCSLNQKFDCPHPEGAHCLDVGEVDKQTSTGSIASPNKKTKKTSFKKLEIEQPPHSPLRTSEQVLSVWIAPYHTEDGTYHEQKRIHFVAKLATWGNANPEIGEDVK